MVIRSSSIGVPTESATEGAAEKSVLMEMLPLKYKLLNMKPSAWNNITFIKEISLGKILFKKCHIFYNEMSYFSIGSLELENPNSTDSHFEGEIIYSFPTQTNTTFLSNYPINGLPVEMSDEADETKNFIVGSINKNSFNSVRC